MAYLLNVGTGTCFPLMPHHTFGRMASAVNTHVDKPYISKLHAAIEWNGTRWLIKHLGLNNTWLNELALAQGEIHPLALHDLIHIAELSDAGFKVMDLTPPQDMLWPVNPMLSAQINPIVLDRFHLLPDAQNPELAIYFNEVEQQWYSDDNQQPNESGKQLLNNNDIVQIANSEWRFIRAQVYGPTEVRRVQTLKLVDLHFIFHVSLDEETTQLTIQHQLQEFDLGVRTHHYLLLQLARHRAADIARNIDVTGQGWVYADQLETELGIDATHINIQIFRARKQLADSVQNLLEQTALVERQSGKIRFGGTQFAIYKGVNLVTNITNQTTLANAT